MRKAGDRLRITAQLVNVADGYHLWSNRYDRQMKDVFAIQDEIARGVAGALRIRLVGQHRGTLVRSSTDNLEAYHLYLKGRYHWNTQTRDGIKVGCEYFEQAITKDPNYAPAYAGISDCYRLLGWWSALPPGEFAPKAREAALGALEINDRLADAHYALGAVRAIHDWQWEDARRDIRRAIELNPSYPTAHQGYAITYLAPMGRFEEAIEEANQAQDLDPLSPFISTILGWVFHLARHYDGGCPLVRRK